MARGRATGSEDAAPDPTMPPGEVAAEVARLSRSIELLEQGLSQMLETMATHTELLSKLLIAATADTKPEQDLTIVLKSVVARLADNQAALRGVERAMVELPGHVGEAVATEIAQALAAVR